MGNTRAEDSKVFLLANFSKSNKKEHLSLQVSAQRVEKLFLFVGLFFERGM